MPTKIQHPYDSEQVPTLFDTDRPHSLYERFQRFHEQNPHVLNQLVALARELRSRGVSQYSINGLFEVLRWQHAIRTEGDPYRLNNSYRSFYARLVLETAPDLGNFFELRSLADERDARRCVGPPDEGGG